MTDNVNKQPNSKVVKRESSSGLPSLTSNNALQIFEVLAKGTGTGIANQGQALLMAMKAKELGIGFGNAIPHMHVINGKPGIDIHIIKAILSKPSNGISWIKTEDYVPVYRYINKDGTIFTEDMLPNNAEVIVVGINDLKGTVNTTSKLHVAYVPTQSDINSPEIYDRRTTYQFTRINKVFGEKVIVKPSATSFSWLDAVAAGLPYNKDNKLDPNSAWQKYRKIMIATRAFTLGARDIASDLLMGNYETTELYDMNNIEYEIMEADTTSTVNIKHTQE